MAITANLVGSGPRSSAETLCSATASAASIDARVTLVSASPVAASPAPGGGVVPPTGGPGGTGGRGSPPWRGGGLGGVVPPGITQHVGRGGAQQLPAADRTYRGHRGLGIVVVALDGRHHLTA